MDVFRFLPTDSSSHSERLYFWTRKKIERIEAHTLSLLPLSVCRCLIIKGLTCVSLFDAGGDDCRSSRSTCESKYRGKLSERETCRMWDETGGQESALFSQLHLLSTSETVEKWDTRVRTESLIITVRERWKRIERCVIFDWLSVDMFSFSTFLLENSLNWCAIGHRFFCGGNDDVSNVHELWLVSWVFSVIDVTSYP